MTNSRLLILLALLGPACGLSAAEDAGYYSAEAARLARLPYAPGYTPATDFAKALTYSNLDRIRIKRANWVFNESSGNLQVEPRLAGSFNSKGIQLNVLEGGALKPIPFSPDFFNFPADIARPADGQLPGYNGFRIHGAPRTGAGSYEQFSFGGASYFRSHAEGLHYGLSARGLILRRNGKEEFPLFENFAFVEPTAGSSEMTICALLNSPSATGAWRIVSKPGNPHVMEVHAEVNLREGLEWKDVETGLGGFSSMYWFSPARLRRTPDFRERVHDSEALAISTESGEKIWRVLGNPTGGVRESAFPVQGMRGFGLIQRERNFAAYEDEVARYERRTSAWVEPLSGMDNGTVTLMEIPTQKEYDDNIVAFFRPATLPAPGTPLRFSYRLLWCDDVPASGETLSKILQTRAGRLPDQADLTLMTVDFERDGGAGQPQIDIQLPPGLEQKFAYLKPLPDGKILRLHLAVKPRAGSQEKSLEIRACLTREGKPVSETWVYPWE